MPLLDVCKVRLVMVRYPWSFLSCPCVRSRCFAFAVAVFTNREGMRRRRRRMRRKSFISHPFIRRTTKIEKKIASLVRWVSPTSILNRNRKTEWTYISTAVPDASFSNARLLSALSSLPNVVVAAGTPGIGQAIALAIARRCPTANITIVGRNQAAADTMLPQLGSKPKFIRAVISLMSEIRTTARQITEVGILIMTKGILTMAGRTPTAENIDNKLALHYYGRALFVKELLPLLRASPLGGKVLFVFDGVRANLSRINWEDMAFEHNYSLSAAADHATSFTDLVIQRFAKQAENANVTFTHASPGGVRIRTPIVDNLPFWARIPAKCAIALRLGSSPDDCAELMVHGMFGTDKGWRCVDDQGELVTKKKVVDESMIDKVWQHTS